MRVHLMLKFELQAQFVGYSQCVLHVLLLKKLPKPVMASELPLANSPEIELIVASKARAASALERTEL
jgi:hypothetical protein